MSSPDPLAAIVARLQAAGVAFTVHEHAPARTVADAQRLLPFPLARYLKTVAFRVKGGGVVLACLRGEDSVDYRGLAEALATRRGDIVRLLPAEVEAELGLEAGAVSPVPTRAGTRVVVDGAFSATDTVYTGVGRPDRTLEIRFGYLIRAVGARLAPIAKAANG